MLACTQSHTSRRGGRFAWRVELVGQMRTLLQFTLSRDWLRVLGRLNVTIATIRYFLAIAVIGSNCGRLHESIENKSRQTVSPPNQ
jgi:hypothetical protein